MVKRYETGDFDRPLAVKDLQTRFCWDMFHRGVTNRTSVGGLYTYLNDSHPDRAQEDMPQSDKALLKA